MNPQLLVQTDHPIYGKVVHVLLGVKDDIVHYLSQSNGKAYLHRALQTGEVVSQELDLPLLRSVLQAADSFLA